MTEIQEEPNGWYFYMKDRSCKIGPYRLRTECQQDFDRYNKTGMISIPSDKKPGDVGTNLEDYR